MRLFVSVYIALFIITLASSQYQQQGFQYLGCFKDQGKRMLRGEYRLFLFMTQQMCLNYCRNRSFKYAGLQFGNQCFCGDETPNEYDRKPESECNSICPGEKVTKCGGVWRNAIYNTGAVPPQHEYVGCYFDEEKRRLKGFFIHLDLMTPRSCIDRCRDLSFKYAGLQLRHLCFCGNEDPNAWDRRNDRECSAECPGDYTSKCGAAWRSSVYKTLIPWNSLLEFQYSDYRYLGCFEDQIKRKLRGELRIFSYMTQQMCISYCKKRSFRYAGLQAGVHCFCGDETPDDSDRKPESECNTNCPGEIWVKCGGGMRNAIYSTGAVPPKHEYAGCYLDEENRRLKGFFTNLISMTPRSCIDLCRDMFFKYAGLQLSHQCFCGNEEPSVLDKRYDCYLDCPGDYTSKCGGTWRNSVYRTLADGHITTTATTSMNTITTTDATTTMTTTSTPSSDSSSQYQQQGFQYLGCFEDEARRKLRGEYRLFEFMTQQMCLNYCKNRSFKYAGLQIGNQCFCGDETPSEYDRKPESDCNSICPGEKLAKCGGVWRNAIYSTGAVPPQYEYVGCYFDEEKRRLKGFFIHLDLMTPRSCIDRCRDLSFKYAGLQFRHQCFCGNEDPNVWDKRNDHECSAECPGDYTSKCGEVWRSSIYKTLIPWSSSLEFRYSDYQYLGCFEDQGKRKLRGELKTFSYMTQEMCMSYCKKRSFRYAGLQAGVQCFCGDETPDDSDRKPESECNLNCPGEIWMKCGGSMRNAIYSTGAVPSKHEYIGCYLDEENRRLKGFFTHLNSMTPRSCIDLCRDMFFKYAGLQLSHQCFCGNEEPSILDKRNDCYVDCPGDYTSKCGGTWRNSVYRTLTASSQYQQQGFQYLGCFRDQGRQKLQREYRLFVFMTQQMCLNYCRNLSFKYAGLQTGNQCFCGDQIPSEYDRKPESDCNSSCPGEKLTKCGGVWRNAIYNTGADIYEVLHDTEIFYR